MLPRRFWRSVMGKFDPLTSCCRAWLPIYFLSIINQNRITTKKISITISSRYLAISIFFSNTLCQLFPWIVYLSQAYSDSILHLRVVAKAGVSYDGRVWFWSDVPFTKGWSWYKEMDKGLEDVSIWPFWTWTFLSWTPSTTRSVITNQQVKRKFGLMRHDAWWLIRRQ